MYKESCASHKECVGCRIEKSKKQNKTEQLASMLEQPLQANVERKDPVAVKMIIPE